MTSNLIEQYNQGRRDFVGADLRGADLRGADLGGADLRGAALRGADLGGANLVGANLGGADLWSASLGGADLRGANLRWADFWSANLRWADFSGADLRRADFSGADISGADLRGADLCGVKGLSTKAQEIQILEFIKQEIVSQSLLDMSEWHTNWQWGESLCGTTHCAAGSAQVWASINGLDEYEYIDPSIAGSMLIPSVAHLFYASNDEFVAYLSGILAGDIPLLDR